MRTLVNGGPVVVIITPGLAFVLYEAQRAFDMPGGGRELRQGKGRE